MAVRYLMLSGEKCVSRFALEQADAYFGEAYRLLRSAEAVGSASRDSRMVELVARWAPVYWYRGDFVGLEELLTPYEALAPHIVQARERARYSLWMGTACWNRQKLVPSWLWLESALQLGEEIHDQLALCLAHSWLAYTLTDLGRIREGIEHGLAAREHTAGLEDEYFVVAHAFGASAYSYWAAGEPEGAIQAGEELLGKVGDSPAVRPRVFADWSMALGHICSGDYARAEEEIAEAIELSADPWTSQFPRMFAGLCCMYRDDFEHAREYLEDVVSFSDTNGAATLGTPARGLLGGALIGLGEMNRGMALLEEARAEFEAGERPWGTVQALFLAAGCTLASPSATSR